MQVCRTTRRGSTSGSSATKNYLRIRAFKLSNKRQNSRVNNSIVVNLSAVSLKTPRKRYATYDVSSLSNLHNDNVFGACFLFAKEEQPQATATLCPSSLNVSRPSPYYVRRDNHCTKVKLPHITERLI